MKLNQKIELSSIFSVEKAQDSEKDSDYITIEGYANTVSKDRQGDIIPQDAWTKGGLKNYQRNPIVLAFHNHSKPVGTVTDLTVDEGGLRVKANIMKSAGEVYQLIKDGVLRAFSIGASIKDMTYDKEGDVFIIKDLELYEISVVSVPANQESLFSLSKCFDTEDEFLTFKKQFLPQDESANETDGSSGAESKDELNMTKEELAQIVNDAIKANQTTAAPAAPAPEPKIELGASGVERLVADVSKRMDEMVKSDVEVKLADALKGLEASIAEKKEELEKHFKSKMVFHDRASADSVTAEEKETAFLVAKALGKDIAATKYGKSLIEKAGPHQSATNGADWEKTVSTNLEADIRRKLVVAPLFRTISMNTPVLRLPINPEAGYANWVNSTDYGSAASSGTAQVHQLTEVTLNTYKLATKEFMTNEEDEDSIIALAPIIRDAVVRRMAKAIDMAHLRGAGSGGADPLNGVAKVGDATGTTASVTTAATVATLTALRKKLGVWGLNPSDLIYVISTEIYYDLLDDTTFQTVDKVGNDRATLLTGQIGMVGGVPVIVSGEYEAKAATKYGAICLNSQNFVRGVQVGLRVESDYIVQEQRRVLVASQRMAFQQLTTANGSGVATFKWVA